MSARSASGGRILRGRAHDEPRILSPASRPACTAARRRSRSASSSMRADTPTPLAFRHVHEVAGRQSDVGRQPRALGPQRILHDLDQDLVAFGHQRADVLRARRLDAGIRMTRIEDVRGVQECRAFHADVDERRLHARQNPRHSSLVDVADQPAAAGALEKHFLQNAVLDDRGARLVRAGIDQNFSAHGAGRGPASARRRRRPAARPFRTAASPSRRNSCRSKSAMKTAARPWMA